MTTSEEDTARLANESIGPALLAVAWVFAGIATIVVGFRYYVRLRVVKTIRIDDWLILITYLLALGNSAFCTIAVHYGLGRHIQFLNPEQILFSIKYVYLCEFFSIMSPGIGRISYAFLLLEIVPPTKWRPRFLWTIIAVQFVVDVGTVIVSFAQCQPIQSFWERPPGAKCWSPIIQEYTGYFQGSVCSLVDLLLAIFPASMFWNMNMKTGTKISLSILMGLGIFAMVCSIVKTIQLRAIGHNPDLTWGMCDLAIWWTLEAYVVLIAASIPSLRAITRKKTPGYSGQYHESGKAAGGTIGSYRLSKRGNGVSTDIWRSGNYDSQTFGRASDEIVLGIGSEDGKSETMSGNVEMRPEGPPGTITKQTTINVRYDMV